MKKIKEIGGYTTIETVITAVLFLIIAAFVGVIYVGLHFIAKLW